MEFEVGFFHFIRPWWLVLLPVAIGLWFAIRKIATHSHWSDYIPQEMLSALQVDGSAQSSFLRWATLALWLLLIVAAAGPSWNKQAVPTLKNQKALAIVLDLSPSMLAEDLSPNRLTRARYKIIDVLRSLQDGQVALIAYSGDAHTVSPLTDDPRTIESLLPALHPNVMPSAGSNVEAAIDLAQQLLKGAGAPNGDILLISDGVTERASRNVADRLASSHRLSVLAVGGSEAAPIPKQGGGFLKNSKGEIVLASVDTAILSSLAIRTGGRFANLRADESDIESLLFADFNGEAAAEAENQTSYDAWVDNGHWIVLLLLPLFVWFFRKGIVYVLPFFFVVPLFSVPLTSEATEQSESTWLNLWRTPDQQATTLFEEERYTEAAEKFQREDWSAIAHYRKGDYEQAASRLGAASDATSIYNRGNALAMNGDLEGALDAYKQVLEQQPDHADAAHNKSVIEKLQQQQEEQKEQQANGDQESDQNEQEQSESQDKKDNSESQQDQNGSENQEDSENSQTESEENDEESSSSQQGSDSEKQTDQEQSEAEQQSDQSTTDSEQDELQEQQTAGEQESQDDPNQEPEESASANAALEPSEDALKDSSEQWLRTIPDDPSGLLRRKFEYQSRQRQQSSQRSTGKSAEERY